MKPDLSDKAVNQSLKISRYGYIFFLLLILYFLVRGNIENAIINLGIALIFDPFDSKVRWEQRPLYQKLWLFVHVSLVFAGFAYLVFR